MSNLVVQTNVLALNSHRNLKVIGVKQTQSSARLSSGYRINSAADDAAGLAISEKMRAQIRGLDMASKNTQDGISLVQTAEGGLQEIDNMIQRIRELVDQAANDTNDFTTNDREKIQEEINQLTQGIDNMSEQVEFNAKKLLDGSLMDKATRSQLLADIDKKLAAAIGAGDKAAYATAGSLSDVSVNSNEISKATATGENGSLGDLWVENSGGQSAVEDITYNPTGISESLLFDTNDAVATITELTGTATATSALQVTGVGYDSTASKVTLYLGTEGSTEATGVKLNATGCEVTNYTIDANSTCKVTVWTGTDSGDSTQCAYSDFNVGSSEEMGSYYVASTEETTVIDSDASQLSYTTDTQSDETVAVFTGTAPNATIACSYKEFGTSGSNYDYAGTTMTEAVIDTDAAQIDYDDLDKASCKVTVFTGTDANATVQSAYSDLAVDQGASDNTGGTFNYAVTEDDTVHVITNTTE